MLSGYVPIWASFAREAFTSLVEFLLVLNFYASKNSCMASIRVMKKNFARVVCFTQISSTNCSSKCGGFSAINCICTVTVNIA